MHNNNLRGSYTPSSPFKWDVRGLFGSSMTCHDQQVPKVSTPIHPIQGESCKRMKLLVSSSNLVEKHQEI